MDSEEPTLTEGVSISGLPLRYKFGSTALVCFLLLPAITLVCAYIFYPEKYPAPQEIELFNIIVVSVLILLFVWMPWESMGIRVSKIGSVEFEQVLRGQATEAAEEFSELRERIVDLEKGLKGLDEISGVSEHLSAISLRPILERFLVSHAPKAFSPVKIKSWGASRPGYEELSSYSQGTIRAVLQSMVASGYASTRISRLGNTLYKVADEKL